MGERWVTDTMLRDHVSRIQQEHPPIRLDSVDRTIRDPRAVAKRFAGTIDYLARVELEVERNVLELLTIMPDASDVDRFFYADVWSHQEIAHGHILDQLKDDLGLTPAVPVLEMGFPMKVMGALSHWSSMQDIARFMYYLTGAATERTAVVAYSRFIKELEQMDEQAISNTVIHPIKVQEPGHYAFYMMSATKMVQQQELAPWQLWLTRQLRSRTFSVVGTHGDPEYMAQMGEVATELGFADELERFAADIARLETRLLWAEQQGMRFPPYFLHALRECVDLYRERGAFTRP